MTNISLVPFFSAKVPWGQLQTSRAPCSQPHSRDALSLPDQGSCCRMLALILVHAHPLCTAAAFPLVSPCLEPESLPQSPQVWRRTSAFSCLGHTACSCNPFPFSTLWLCSSGSSYQAPGEALLTTHRRCKHSLNSSPHVCAIILTNHPHQQLWETGGNDISLVTNATDYPDVSSLTGTSLV